MKAAVKLGLLGLFVAVAAAFGVLQSSDVVHAQAPTGVTKTCVQTAVASTSATCTITIPAGSSFQSTATITLTGPVGATFTAVNATGTGIAASITSPTEIDVACGTPVPPGTSPCTGPITITETVSFAAAAVTNPVGQTVAQTFQPAVDATVPGTVAPLPAAVVTAFASPGAPSAFTVTCSPVVGLPAIPGFTPAAGTTGGAITGIPGQIGTLPVVGVGVLPSPVTCSTIPTPSPSVPGTYEISSINGALLDASGSLSTNLRIGCGNFAAATPSCTGVIFSVLGAGVGFVEVRVRFEPAPIVVNVPSSEVVTNVAFVAPIVSVSLLLNPNPVTVGATGTATARFNRTANCSLATGVIVAGGTACIDPTTGLPIVFNLGSALNGNVVFSIDNTAIASWVGQQPTAAAGAPSATAGFVTTANQTIVRCGFFATTGLPVNTITGFVPGTTALGQFFGGCESATATYRGNVAGVANVSATFVPDLPGAFGSGLTISQNVSALLGLFGNAINPTNVRALEVIGAAPSGRVDLARGCNNVSPTVSETATAYAARVTPAGALVAIWEHQAATNTFRGFSPQAGAPNDLAAVTRLKPVFICVSGAAQLDQPAA